MIVLASLPGRADEKQPDDPNAKANPLPPEKGEEKDRIRLPDKLFFLDVQDKRPIASKLDNPGEHQAYVFVFEHLKKFNAEALARHSRRDVGYADLIKEDRSAILRQLIRVEGRLVRVRQHDAGELLNDPKTKSIYEGWIEHADESQHLTCITFTELPEGITVGDRLGIPVSFDGYYFKLYGYLSGAKDPKGKNIWRSAPLLIGRMPIIKAPTPEPPAVDPDALSFQQVQLPTVGVKYESIGDAKPLADPADNPDEWEAYKRIIAHASQVPHSALQLRHREGVAYTDLVGPDRLTFARQLFFFKGRLIELRKVELGDAFKSAKLKDLYEGWMYHDGDLRSPMKIVVTELPEGFKLGDAIDEPVAIDAYYFKLANFSGEKMAGQPAPKYAPILIGRSFRLVSTVPPPVNPELSEAEQIALPSREFFSQVKDKRELGSVSVNYDEYLAYTFCFEHVMRFSPEMLARNSRRDIVYADLINEIRDPEYLRKLLHVEGRLVRIRQREAKDFLKIPNVDYVYEGWIYHNDMREHPIVVAFTELPEGMVTGERISYPVSVDGFYFKLLGYKSQEKDQKGKDVWRVAPLLVARRPMVLPDERDKNFSWSGFIPLVAGVIGGVMIVALFLTFWFRRGDRQIRARVRETMLTNPFENAQPPAVQPGAAWNGVNEKTPPTA